MAQVSQTQTTELTFIDPKDPRFDFYLAYGTENNVSGKQIYVKSHCYLRPEAAEMLFEAAKIADNMGYRFLIWDAYRPPEGQQKLWDACPDATFVSPPEKGSPHSRGVAVDLTLCHKETGKELDMGTGFDDFTPKAFHTCQDLPREILHNRHVLLGIMTLAGWDFYKNEWWHYQLHQARNYAVIGDGTAGQPMMR